MTLIMAIESTSVIGKHDGVLDDDLFDILSDELQRLADADGSLIIRDMESLGIKVNK